MPPYLFFTSNLWSVKCKYFEENWSCYNGSPLYSTNHHSRFPAASGDCWPNLSPFTVLCGFQAHGPFHPWIFHHNSNQMQIFISFYPTSNQVIATKFCTCHDSYVVMTCAKFCSKIMTRNGKAAFRIYHQNWRTIHKLLMRWVPTYCWIPRSIDPAAWKV